METGVHTVLNPQVDVNLVQDIAHARGHGVGEDNEAQVRGGFVEVKLVLGGAEADEGIVVAAELADHVAQGKDGAEDELRLVRGGVRRRGGRRGTAGAGGRVRVLRVLDPGFRVDAFSWSEGEALVGGGE